MLEIPAVSEVVDKAKFKKFIREFRRGRVQTTSDGDAALFGALATLCFTVNAFRDVGGSVVNPAVSPLSA
jgi:hypothetical protein